ncbi:MAG: hypothetical protein DRH26_10190 [Deltaproteobacteria bacterium]|nr:MAG: hypothetical protein DRH26_10190 [Deltaproteobacteria bacterium]
MSKKIISKIWKGINSIANKIYKKILKSDIESEGSDNSGYKPQPVDTKNKNISYDYTSKDKYILTLVISIKETELADSLKSEGCLTRQTAEKLFESKQWLLYSQEKHWKDTCQGLFENPHQESDEYDVYYIKITLDRPDERFSRDSNMLKMYDAFKELAEKENKIQISERQPKESYENKGFYRV